MAFEELKAQHAEMWGAAPWERFGAPSMADIHDDLVRRLGVRAGEHWLDLATGTGTVATRAPRRGAVVTGLDLAPKMIQTAQRLAAEAGLEITYEVGDVEDVPHPAASFDTVSSAMGVIAAPDHEAVARELARMRKPGGRIGLAAWRPDGHMGGQFALLAKYLPPPPEGIGNGLDWGRRDYTAEMLGAAFDLEFFDGQSPEHGESPESLWEMSSTSIGPVKAMLASLDAGQQAQLRADFIEDWGRYRTADGTVAMPREYLIILGHRKTG
jgi:SAM-dependent methyltransferase